MPDAPPKLNTDDVGAVPFQKEVLPENTPAFVRFK
jgi:hypothetical protein